MGSRGRTSLAGLAVVPVSGQRIAPPVHLTEDQVAEWTEIVDSLPADYFRPGDVPLLAAFCVASALHKRAQAEIESAGMFVEDKWGRKGAHPAISILNSQAAAMATMATKLRLAPSARYSEKTAATKTAKAGARRPWDDGGSQAAE